MWPNSQESAYLATFTEEILNGELHSLHIGKTGSEVRIFLYYK